MKESLVKLLFEEYKQICLFRELEKKGIDLNNIAVQNSEIVLDLVGFPEDNTLEYDLNSMNEIEHNPNGGKKLDDDIFCRDWLFNPYYDLIDSIEKKQKIEVTDKGLKLVEEDDEILALEKISEYVDWLYKEFYNWKSEK
jgi:hypothetical protein